jgi:hypothetical protein
MHLDFVGYFLRKVLDMVVLTRLHSLCESRIDSGVNVHAIEAPKHLNLHRPLLQMTQKDRNKSKGIVQKKDKYWKDPFLHNRF